MKKIKKLVALVLTGVVVLAMGTVAFAATPSASDTGSITIRGLGEGVTANAYQIAKATYDDSGNFAGYEMTVSGDFNFVIAPDGSYDESALTEANLATLYNSLGNVEAVGSATVSYGSDSATINDLPVGSYLIVITGSESVAYGMMIGSVSYAADENGNWIIDNGSFSVEDSEIWAKATTPTVEKTEHHANGDATHGESANAGDEITFDIIVKNIPSYQGDYPEFDVLDTLTGLTISDSELAALTVTVVNETQETIATLINGTDYTVTKSDTGESFDVNFVVDGKYTLNNYAGMSLVIEYAATVVDDQDYKDGEAEHDNDAVLTYATTSFRSHAYQDNEGTAEDEDYEYTFTMRAMKVDKAEESLAEAQFALYTDSSCDTAYMQNGYAVTSVSDEDGYISFSGLQEGIYYLKETKSPAGYLLNEDVYTIKISAEYSENGMINTWSIEISDKSGVIIATATQSADTGLAIINTKTGLLPSMGGRGTMIFTLIGCAIVACAVVGVVANRRKRAA